MNRKWMTALILAAFLAVSGSAFADHDQDDDHGHGHGKGNPHARHDDDRWERRGNYEYHVFEGNTRPLGWSQGKKTGWGDCGMPPGQAKKYGCRTYTYQDRPYYYYQNNQGQVIVRRPTIEIQGSVVVH